MPWSKTHVGPFYLPPPKKHPAVIEKLKLVGSFQKQKVDIAENDWIFFFPAYLRVLFVTVYFKIFRKIIIILIALPNLVIYYSIHLKRKNYWIKEYDILSENELWECVS